MRATILAVAVAAALCGPASACDFAAADFRDIFDRTIAPRAGLKPVSDYNCQQENGGDLCSMVTPSTVEFTVADAPDVHRASFLTMTFQHAPSPAALQAIYAGLAALCSPTVPEADRLAALVQAQAQPMPANPTFDGPRVIIGDVSYRFTGGGSLRIKDRRLPNLRGVNTSDDE